MKRILSFLSALVFAVSALAQSPREIIVRMEAEMDKHADEGIILTLDTKVPILGTVTMRIHSRGEKARSDTKMMGQQITTWTDGDTEWTYTSKTHTVTITSVAGSKSAENGDVALLSGIADGYDVTLTKETADAWYIACRRSASNTDKDAPGKMDLVVAKGTYYPKSLKTKVKGLTVTMHDVSFGVSEKYVTFNLNDYPGAVVEDKRD